MDGIWSASDVSETSHSVWFFEWGHARSSPYRLASEELGGEVLSRLIYDQIGSTVGVIRTDNSTEVGRGKLTDVWNLSDTYLETSALSLNITTEYSKRSQSLQFYQSEDNDDMLEQPDGMTTWVIDWDTKINLPVPTTTLKTLRMTHLRWEETLELRVTALSIFLYVGTRFAFSSQRMSRAHSYTLPFVYDNTFPAVVKTSS
jgi:hypothetical protein